MSAHNSMLTRPWLLLAVAVVLIAGHSLILRYALQHRSLSAATAIGVVILVVLTHVGLPGRLYALFKRQFSAMKCCTSPIGEAGPRESFNPGPVGR